MVRTGAGERNGGATWAIPSLAGTRQVIHYLRTDEGVSMSYAASESLTAHQTLRESR